MLRGTGKALRSCSALVFVAACLTTVGVSPPASAANHSLARPTGDFNRDGYEDLAVGVPYEDLRLLNEDDEPVMIPNAGVVHIFYGSEDGLSATGNQLIWQGAGDPRLDVREKPEKNDYFGLAVAAGDFDHDRFDDLAIGAPGETTTNVSGQHTRSGAVHILYGSSNGLQFVGNQIWKQDIRGFGGRLEKNDRFGYSLATGDFGHGRYDDLAIGIVNDTVPGPKGKDVRGGSVSILYGSYEGLGLQGEQRWYHGNMGVPNVPEGRASFGFALVAADFGRSAQDDLGIAVPFDVDLYRGSVFVLYGSGRGLEPPGQLWQRQTPGIKGESRHYTQFGVALGAGDFDLNGSADLAISSEEGIRGPGAVNVIYSSEDGLNELGNQLWRPDPDDFSRGDEFGHSLAGGNLGAGAETDLAIGAPGIDLNSFNGRDGGAVGILYGSPSGLSESPIYFSQDVGVLSDPDSGGGDYFGASVTIGDFDNDDFGDVVVGAPGEDFGDAINAGVFNVLYGSVDGVTLDGQQLWNQDTPGVLDRAEHDDHLGIGRYVPPS